MKKLLIITKKLSAGPVWVQSGVAKKKEENGTGKRFYVGQLQTARMGKDTGH